MRVVLDGYVICAHADLAFHGYVRVGVECSQKIVRRLNMVDANAWV